KLSKGMLQRVGLAQALINDPEIVFLDEPMSGLDPVGRREVRDLIASLRTEGKTVFMCSHILSDIEVLCDNVAILKKGRLAHAGSLDELRAQESNLIEIVAAGANESVLRENLDGNAQVLIDASGFRIHVQHEREIDDVIAAVRKANGKLVSVQPVRQSLEELFL
ncbi:MAG TPA: ABC transporter ATP-binding protein, partial [Pyrinomonadaceae bacterium]|nr:ABC transporter ATP-binding protein [Pyrinomonadaceae bacterium]